MLRDELVDAAQEPGLLEVGVGDQRAETTGAQDGRAAHRREASDHPHSTGGKGMEVEIAPFVAADQLHRRVPARPLEVLDLVPALVELTDAVEPPVHVAAAVPAREADVLTGRDRDDPSGTAQLVGDLHARRRCADHEHVAVTDELRGAAVVERGDLLDVRWEGRGQVRHPRLARTASSRRRRHRTSTIRRSSSR